MRKNKTILTTIFLLVALMAAGEVSALTFTNSDIFTVLHLDSNSTDRTGNVTYVATSAQYTTTNFKQGTAAWNGTHETGRFLLADQGINITLTDNYTVSCRIWSNTAQEETILTDNGLNEPFFGNDDDLQTYIRFNPRMGGTCLQIANESFAYADSRWHTFVATVEAKIGRQTLYIDGEQHAQETSCTYDTAKTNMRFLWFTKNAISPYRDLGGLTDDCWIAKVAVTAQDVADIYNDNLTWPFADSTQIDVTLNSPDDNDHDDQALSVDYNFTHSAGLAINTTLFVNNTINATSLNVANGTRENISSVGMSIDGTYSWILQLCDTDFTCTNTTARTFILDTNQPTITFIYPVSAGNVSTGNLSTNITVDDANLFRINYTVYFSNGSVFFNNYLENLTGNSSWTLEDKVNMTEEDNYTIEVIAVDSHTFGSLNGLEYAIDNKGITFSRGLQSKRFWFGYWAGGTYNFLSDAQIQTYDISTSIVEENGEYNWHLNYKKPVANVKFGFAFEKEQHLQLINPAIGHFVWAGLGINGWYIDFADIVDAGYELNVTEKTVNNVDYWVVYTDTSQCSSATGEMCQI